MFLLPQAALSADRWQSCLQLTDDQARLACYDAYAQRLLTREDPPVSAEQQEADFGKRPQADAEEQRPAMPVAEQEAEFGKPPKVAAEEIDKIQASITKVQVKSHGKRVLTLDNGQVWVQLDSRSLPRFKEGDSIIIKRLFSALFYCNPWIQTGLFG